MYTDPVPILDGERPEEELRPRRLARPVLVAFLFTFMAARVLVFLIVARRIPDVYLSLGGTHVHHSLHDVSCRSTERDAKADILRLRLNDV
jgi:hypothetical protein